MHKGPRYHPLVPNQYMRGGPWVEVFRGSSLAVGSKGGSIRGVSTQASLGKMSCLDDILPKKGKYELGPLAACHRDR